MNFKPRRVRRTCSRCKKIGYPKIRDIDYGDAHFLCSGCDSLYITWQNRRDGNVYVDDFLKACPWRK